MLWMFKYLQRKMWFVKSCPLLTSAFDFWDDLSRTSSHDRSESSDTLRFLRDFKSAEHKQQKHTGKTPDSPVPTHRNMLQILPEDLPRGDILFLPES